MTYQRRYTLTALLGVTTEEDVDGNAPVTQREKPAQAAAPVQPTPHWIDDPKVKARFWTWTRNDMGLTDEQVHAALEVEHIADYEGTMQEARTQIEGWAAAQAAMEAMDAEPVAEGALL